MAMGRTWGSVPWLFPVSAHKKRSSKPESLIDEYVIEFLTICDHIFVLNTTTTTTTYFYL
jgi:hypothetical protein